MKKTKRFKMKPPRIVEESKLEKMYDGSENWLDKYLLEFAADKQENCLERASFLVDSVPRITYLKLASLFGLDPYKIPRTDGSNRCMIGPQAYEDEQVEDFIRLVETEIGCRTAVSEDNQVEVGTPRNSIRDDKKLPGQVQDNPYLKFVKRKSSAEQLATARNNLGRKSEEITKNIISNFLEWFRSIGGEDAEEETTIDEAIIQDLFRIGFESPTARAIALRIKEMPVIPEGLANLRNEPEFSEKRGLKALVKMDIELEEKPPKLFAFGTMLPKEKPPLRFQPPRNQVKKTWTECERVPSELESLKVVWEGIENLRSTIAFSSWLKKHPEITPPDYLKEKGLLDINYDEWMQMFKGFERDIESEGVDADFKQQESGEDQIELVQMSKSVTMDDFVLAGQG